jgi:hypothetical protein
MQDRKPQLDENLLQRTAGPYIRVKLRRTEYEHMFSASPSALDIARHSRRFAFGPTSGHWSACFVIFIPSDADCDDRPADWISERKKLERRGGYIWP